MREEEEEDEEDEDEDGMADVSVNFDQLVRIFVDTDVNTHFIVSVARTSTVAELRGTGFFSVMTIFICFFCLIIVEQFVL